MLSDPASEARLRAYALMEAAQGHDFVRAGEELAALEHEAGAQGWADVELLAHLGGGMWQLVRSPDRAAVERRLEAAVARAEGHGDPGLLGLALALRAVDAAGRFASDQALADAGRAVALADDDGVPALDRCTVLVVCGAAYNALSQWELADELFDGAAELEPLCEVPVQAPAVAANRVLVRMELATELLEVGSEVEACRQLRRAAAAVGLAVETPGLPPLWLRGMEAARALLTLVVPALEEPASATWTAWVDERLAELATVRAGLDAHDEVEVLPLFDALLALGLLRLGRHDEARATARALVPTGSATTGARSFPAWVRAEVLSAGTGGEAMAVQREYAALLARTRWSAREGVLAAARSRIAAERLGVEHARLARDVLLDPLTGLSNRRCFDDWLTAPPGREAATALLLVDLDSFKEVNDVHGHAVGDAVLRRLGALLADHVRPGDLALRLGGDEFALVMTDEPGSLPQVQRAAQERARGLQEAVAAGDWEKHADGLAVRVSVGVAVGLLGRGREVTADELYREADADLYAAKARLRVARS